MSIKSPLTAQIVKLYALPITVVVIVTIIAVLGSDLALWLRYDRTAIIAGEYWRVLSGHFVHLTWTHLGLNVFGLALIWLLFGKILSAKLWLLVFLFGCAFTSLGLFLVNKDLIWYVGLSGVLHTLFVAGCLYDIQTGRNDGKYLLAAVSAKLLWEQIAGPLPGSETAAGGKVIVDAHLYGAIAGAMITSAMHVLLPQHAANTKLQ